MSLQDDLAAVKRCLEDLVRTVGQLERSITAETGAAPTTPPTPPPPAPGPPDLVTIPDTPYDRGLWTDVDDEGLGASDRHAP